MVGIGGIHAELLKDVTFMRAPISPSAARSMLEQLKLYPLLKGVRGAKSCDIEAVAKTISDFSAFVAARMKNSLPHLRLIPCALCQMGVWHWMRWQCAR